MCWCESGLASAVEEVEKFVTRSDALWSLRLETFEGLMCAALQYCYLSTCANGSKNLLKSFSGEAAFDHQISFRMWCDTDIGLLEREEQFWPVFFNDECFCCFGFPCAPEDFEIVEVIGKVSCAVISGTRWKADKFICEMDTSS